MELNWIAITVAILGSAGLGGVVTSIINGITLHKTGVAGREDDRRRDITVDRDFAWAKVEAAERAAEAADTRADRERELRIGWQETAARLRRQLINAGLEPVNDKPIKKE